jgi:general secretion pathway protein I
MPRTRQRGFTLLELLVAFVILALAVGVLMRSFGQGLRNAALTEEYTLATLHVESVLATLGVEEPLSEGELGGEFDDGYWWQASIRRYEDPDAPQLEADTGITPYQVTVRVYWGEESRDPHSLSLETLRLGVDEVF